jgi:cardiolipin synthase
MLPISFGTLLKRIVQAVLAVQGATLAALFIVDHRRKKLRKPATFPRLPPRSVTVGGSEVTVYTYGEDLYRDMLNAISQAKSRIFFESFIWKADAVGQAFKDALIDAANRGVKVYVSSTNSPTSSSPAPSLCFRRTLPYAGIR